MSPSDKRLFLRLEKGDFEFGADLVVPEGEALKEAHSSFPENLGALAIDALERLYRDTALETVDRSVFRRSIEELELPERPRAD